MRTVFLAVLAASWSAAAVDDEAFPIVLIAGAGNAAAHGRLAELPPALRGAKSWDTMVWQRAPNTDGVFGSSAHRWGWSAYSPVLAGGRYGVEASFIGDLSKSKLVKGVVAVSAPGSTMANFTADHHHDRQSGHHGGALKELLREFDRAISTAPCKPHVCRAAALILVAGERDAREEETAKLFPERLRSMVADVRSATNEEHLPVLIAMPNPSSTSVREFPGLDRIRTSESALAQKDGACAAALAPRSPTATPALPRPPSQRAPGRHRGPEQDQGRGAVRFQGLVGTRPPLRYGVSHGHPGRFMKGRL